MDQRGVLEVLHEMGIEKYRMSGDNSQLKISCPLAAWRHEKGSDSHPSFFISLNPTGASLAYCHACKFRGSLLGLLYELRKCGQSYDTLIYQTRQIEMGPEGFQMTLENMYGPEMIRAYAEEQLEVWSEGELDVYKGRVPQYALRRGFSKETCNDWELGYAEHDKRLIIPVRRSDGGLVGMVGRSVDGKEPKYLSFLNFKKSKYLFGEHKISSPTDGGQSDSPILVVEGQLDVISLSQRGYQAVGIMGSHMSEVQAERLISYDRPLYLMFDGDGAGVEALRSSKERLFGRTQVFACTLPENTDPAGLTEGELRDVLDSAKLVLSLDS